MQGEDYALIRSLLGGGGPLFEIFRMAGYEVTWYLTGWKGSRCTSFVDYCIRRGIVGSTAWYLGELAPLASLLKSSVSRPETTTAIQIVTNLADDVKEASAASSRNWSGPMSRFLIRRLCSTPAAISGTNPDGVGRSSNTSTSTSRRALLLTPSKSSA